MLSFQLKGLSIAIDFPIDAHTQALIDVLNETVLKYGGRIYLAKDLFTREEHFRAMEPRLTRWEEVRRHWDPNLRIQSAQSVRVLGDSA